MTQYLTQEEFDNYIKKIGTLVYERHKELKPFPYEIREADYEKSKNINDQIDYCLEELWEFDRRQSYLDGYLDSEDM